jgi:hypothetical protein
MSTLCLVSIIVKKGRTSAISCSRCQTIEARYINQEDKYYFFARKIKKINIWLLGLVEHSSYIQNKKRWT